jgi:ketol-acid reductoisomerase
MKEVLTEIQKDKGAKFATEWLAESKNGYPNFNKLREAGLKHPIEQVGQKLRGMMKFLGKK